MVMVNQKRKHGKISEGVEAVLQQYGDADGESKMEIHEKVNKGVEAILWQYGDADDGPQTKTQKK